MQAVQKVESISRLVVITFMLTVSKRILNLFRYIRTDVVRRTHCNKSLPYVVHMKITFKENRKIVYVAFLVLISVFAVKCRSRVDLSSVLSYRGLVWINKIQKYLNK